MAFSENSAQRSTKEFALLGRKLSARRSTRMFVKPSGRTIVINWRETSKSHMKKIGMQSSKSWIRRVVKLFSSQFNQ